MTHSENNLPSTGKMIRRSLLRQCPRCANRSAWFTSWFKQGERCIGCGIKRTRDTDGHELGSMTIASVLNIVLIMAAIGIAVAFTAPDVPVLTLYIVLASAALVFPVLTWPMTHTLWMAIDLIVRPMDVDEVAEAQAWLVNQS
ncbi:MAG: hypothetical protein F2909_07355 [Actinobacteria bacterium]|nr:hypothetical protein [Actinomycetota bacterium]MSX16152.1 hypothetical protein [Actinomycetota bacterium]MSZ72727.1 hypothetical protein [Actinomycetota bacterium]